MSPPRGWVTVSTWLLTGLMALAWALCIMLQWALWLAVTMLLFDRWGGILGGLIAAVQMWLMFGTAKNQSCEVPRP